MIFRVKHRWPLALIVTAIWTLTDGYLGGWTDWTGGPYSLGLQILWGLGGGISALVINGLVHEVLRHCIGARYVEGFQEYGRDILDGMRWPEFLTGGLMAAVAEEPFFRGVILRAFERPILGVVVAAVVFALCHWLKREYFGFWLWALWEGILFGILFVMTGSLLVPMLAHGLHDVAAYRVIQSLVRTADPID